MVSPIILTSGKIWGQTYIRLHTSSRHALRQHQPSPLPCYIPCRLKDRATSTAGWLWCWILGRLCSFSTLQETCHISHTLSAKPHYSEMSLHLGTSLCTNICSKWQELHKIWKDVIFFLELHFSRDEVNILTSGRNLEVDGSIGDLVTGFRWGFGT